MGRQSTGNTEAVTMLDHVKELRLRLIVAAIVLVTGGVIGYLFFEPILHWLKSPLQSDLYYTSPAGSFNFVMKIVTMVGIGLAIPVIIYQIIMFIRPALPKAFSKLRIYGYTGISVLLAAAGAAFGFYFILPGALHFFAGFQVEGLSALIGAESYLSFVTNVLITFMVVFQIPLLLVIVDHIKPISPKSLLKAEKYVVLGGLVVSFFVPFALDLTTSLLIATPIVVLYNLSIVMIVWRHMFAKKQYVEIVTRQRNELIIDDELVTEFFEHAPERVKPIALAPIADTPGLRGFAMEFQRSRQASIDELRKTIERERALTIAHRVAQYNQPIALKHITDIR
ncbi:MAG: twin-arginine translocase subunit TatC [Candidatus Saccharimonadales bacterium]